MFMIDNVNKIFIVCQKQKEILLEINYSFLSAEMHRCCLATGFFTLIESSIAGQKGSKRDEE